MSIAQTIRGAGLDQFYEQRTPSAAIDAPAVAAAEDADAAEAAGLVVRQADGTLVISLLLEGIRCSACTWLIESYMKCRPGICTVSVNFSSRRAHVAWDPQRTNLSTLLSAIAAIGYRGHPYDPSRREALARREARALLLQTGIALLAMMQVMMFAVPGYLGDSIEPEYQVLLDWASLVLCLPVVAYSAAPFFRGAWRDLRLHRAGMDVPVALGIGGAFVASAWATISGTGTTYYDSVTMFVALLLVARLCEFHVRQRAAESVEATARDLPSTVERLNDYPDGARGVSVGASALRNGDCIRVPVGAAIPVDGVVLDGRSTVEEALLTGESWPRAKAVGDTVLAGSLNRDSPLVVRATAVGEATTLAALERLVERAASARPRIARLADRISVWFVGSLLLLASVTGAIWWFVDPARALAVTLAVLVVSCPCALSLATPAALAAAAAALARRRVLAVRPDALETLSRVTHVVLDKTGTVTTGEVRLTSVETLGAYSTETCLSLVATLEQGSSHPIALALRARAQPGDARAARDIVAVPGCGVAGAIAGRRYRLGRPEWAAEIHGRPQPPLGRATAVHETPVALCDETGWLAWLCFGDSLRPQAAEVVAALRGMRLRVSLVSGDRAESVGQVAAAIGIPDFHAGARPDEKREFIARLQQQGEIVAMVGDGVNDAPALAQADVSLSFASAATLTQWTADVVALGSDLRQIADAIRFSRRAFTVIRQNLAWALAYNVVAIPLAAAGQLTPQIAALGMSLSSVLVVANAMRLLRRERLPAATEKKALEAAPARVA